MVLGRESFDPIEPAIASVSVGYGLSSKPSLPEKISAVAKAGFKGLELGFSDLVAFASTHHDRSVEATDYDALVSAAAAVKKSCDDAELEIILLQPFTNFEGWAEDSSERKAVFERAQGWIKIMTALECKTLQVGSSDSPEEKIGTDRARFVADLKELADMLAEQELQLAYANWCWSSHAPDWKDAWDIVRSVDKPNVGLCLNTFHIAGGEWADPSTESGLLEHEETTREVIEKRFKNSMLDLITTIDPQKIYVLQISDAYKPASPIAAAEQGQAPKHQWSVGYRPAPFNDGYLPVVEITTAVLQTGFRGWFSYETFDMGPEGNGRKYKLDEFAKEALDSHEKLLDECVQAEGVSADKEEDKSEKKDEEDTKKDEIDKEEDDKMDDKKDDKKDEEQTDVNKEKVDTRTVKKQELAERSKAETKDEQQTDVNKEVSNDEAA